MQAIVRTLASISTCSEIKSHLRVIRTAHAVFRGPVTGLTPRRASSTSDTARELTIVTRFLALSILVSFLGVVIPKRTYTLVMSMGIRVEDEADWASLAWFSLVLEIPIRKSTLVRAKTDPLIKRELVIALQA